MEYAMIHRLNFITYFIHKISTKCTAPDCEEAERSSEEERSSWGRCPEVPRTSQPKYRSEEHLAKKKKPRLLRRRTPGVSAPESQTTSWH